MISVGVGMYVGEVVRVGSNMDLPASWHSDKMGCSRCRRLIQAPVCHVYSWRRLRRRADAESRLNRVRNFGVIWC
jgi:hypothetical protein